MGLCLLLAGCGGVAGGGQIDAESTLLLADRPSARHVGIYLAVSRGFDEAEGVELTIRRSGDPVKLLRTGRVQAALLEREQIDPASAVCVLALLQTPEPGPFLCVLRTTLEDRRPEVRAMVRALQRGYGEAAVDPESAVQAEVSAVPSLDRAALSAELDALGTAFVSGAPGFGYLDPDTFRPPQFDPTLVRAITRG